MAAEKYNVVGIMSGTSLDGIDLAHIHFSVDSGKWDFEISQTATIPYTEEWLAQLREAVGFSAEKLETLNRDYTQLLGNTINRFISENHLQNLDAVCSHGHTILHQPQNGITLQIGNLREIAVITRQKVVCDFRVGDVQLGGQGAPLVPIGDRILFPEFDYCLNLGGFSNVSFDSNDKRIAFDISPVNTVLNFYANKLGLAYDDKGKISKTGKVDAALMAELNAIDYYAKPFPKSLGFESVKEMVLPLIEKHEISIEDKLRTFTEHIALQTAFALPNKTGRLLVTGGGAYNDFLILRMQHYLPEMELVIPTAKILEFKEALIFALLGVLKIRNEINVLASVTGAKHDHSSGIVYEKIRDSKP